QGGDRPGALALDARAGGARAAGRGTDAGHVRPLFRALHGTSSMSVADRSRTAESGRFSELAACVTVAPGAEREDLEIENPAVGERLGCVPRCTAEDVE